MCDCIGSSIDTSEHLFCLGSVAMINHSLRALYNGWISRAGRTQWRRNYTEIRKENRAQWLELSWGLSPSSAFLPQCHSVSGTPSMEIMIISITEQKLLKFWELGTRLGNGCEGLYSIYLRAAASVLTTIWVASPPSIKVIIAIIIIIMSTRSLHCVSFLTLALMGTHFVCVPLAALLAKGMNGSK